MVGAATDLRERLRALPGMDRLLPALSGLAPSYLVGGAVRDLLRGASSVDLDLAVEGDAPATARELALRLGGVAVLHDRFGTATVRAGPLVIDLATTRRERYERPGALPEVEPAPLAEDLRRRDFSINAMALGLAEDELARLHDPCGGAADLDAGLVRVLHERSFVDDPTRMLRAVRYEKRLGFTIEPGTEQLARAAARDRALDTVSGPRVRDELVDLLSEVEAPAAVARLAELGIDRALHPALAADADLASRTVAAAREVGADQALALLAALIASAPDALDPWLEGLALGAAARDAVRRAAAAAPRLASDLRTPMPRSRLYSLLRPEPPEALAVALALGAPREAVLAYVRDLRQVRLEVTGDDLIAAGVAQSPALGRALEETLRRKLDGQVAGREGELALARRLASEAT